MTNLTTRAWNVQYRVFEYKNRTTKVYLSDNECDYDDVVEFELQYGDRIVYKNIIQVNNAIDYAYEELVEQWKHPSKYPRQVICAFRDGRRLPCALNAQYDTFDSWFTYMVHCTVLSGWFLEKQMDGVFGDPSKPKIASMIRDKLAENKDAWKGIPHEPLMYLMLVYMICEEMQFSLDDYGATLELCKNGPDKAIIIAEDASDSTEESEDTDFVEDEEWSG